MHFTGTIFLRSVRQAQIHFPTFGGCVKGSLCTTACWTRRHLFFEFSPEVLHRSGFRRPDGEQVGLDSTCVFEPFGHLAGRMPRCLVPDKKHLACSLFQQRLQILNRVVGASFLIGPGIDRSGGQVQTAVQCNVIVRLWNHQRTLFSDRLPLPAERRWTTSCPAFDPSLVLNKHRGVGSGLRNGLHGRLKPLSVGLRTHRRQFPPGARPAVIESVQSVANRFRMNIHVQLSAEMLCNSVGCPSGRVFSFFGWVRLQKLFDFFLNLLVDFWRTSLAVSIMTDVSVWPEGPSSSNRSTHLYPIGPETS